LSSAKALLPALVIGYLVPTTLVFLPYSAPNMWTTQAMVALWQPSPWFVDSLIWVFSKLYSKSGSSTGPEKPRGSGRTADVPYLTRIYTVTFTVATLSHLMVVYLCLFSTDIEHSFQHLFFPPATKYITVNMSFTQSMLVIFQADFWIIFAASLVWAYMAIWDLKRIGKADVNLLQAGMIMLAGTIVVGPAATVAGVWYWREVRMVQTQENKAP